MADPFAALADPTRRRILELLAEGERPASDFIPEFKLAKQTISKHLQVLLLAGLVIVRAERQWRHYSLNYEGVAGIETWVHDLQRRTGP